MRHAIAGLMIAALLSGTPAMAAVQQPNLDAIPVPDISQGPGGLGMPMPDLSPPPALVPTDLLPEAPAAAATMEIQGPKTFFRANLANFSKAVLKFGAVSFDDPRMVDDYARIAHCDLARRYLANEFEWSKIRAGIVKSVELEKSGYPYRFVYTDQIRLGNYDFARNGYPFSAETPLKGIGNIVIKGGAENACIDRSGLQHFPTEYRIIFSKPITLDALVMPQKDGERLLARMKTRHNDKRVVYLRFNFEVRAIQMSDVVSDPYFSSGSVMANISARLHSIDFFEDRDEKMPIASWTPQESRK